MAGRAYSAVGNGVYLEKTGFALVPRAIHPDRDLIFQQISVFSRAYAHVGYGLFPAAALFAWG